MKDELMTLVDGADRELGHGPKLDVDVKALLHRAVSGFVFSKEGDLLVQRQAAGKYRSGRLLANSRCSHPRLGEDSRHYGVCGKSSVYLLFVL
jgi:isopentenyl-diphosphate Delta-isomerase